VRLLGPAQEGMWMTVDRSGIRTFMQATRPLQKHETWRLIQGYVLASPSCSRIVGPQPSSARINLLP